MRELTRRWVGDDLEEDVVDVREMVLGRMAAEGEMDLDRLIGEFVWIIDLETLSSIEGSVFHMVSDLVHAGVLSSSRQGRTISWGDKAIECEPIPAPDYEDKQRLGKGRSWHVNEARADVYDRVHELGRFAKNRCAVEYCDVEVAIPGYCYDHAQDDLYETPEIARLREELDVLQGAILNLAGVALAPYVRALGALDDSRRVLGLVQDANGERCAGNPALLERILIYDKGAEVEGRGEIAHEDWEPARAQVLERFESVQERLRELKRTRRKVAKQTFAAGIAEKIDSALVYAGVDKGERER